MKLKINYKDPSELIFKLLDCVSVALSEDKQLTQAEIKVLVGFMLLDDKFKWARFSVPAKKRLLLNLKEQGVEITSQNLNAKISYLVGKGFIVRDEDNVLYLNPLLEQLAKMVSREFKGEFKLEITFTDEIDKRNPS